MNSAIQNKELSPLPEISYLSAAAIAPAFAATLDADEDYANLQKLAAGYANFTVYGSAFSSVKAQAVSDEVLSLTSVLDKWCVRGIPTRLDPVVTACLRPLLPIAPLTAMKAAAKFFTFPPPTLVVEHLTWQTSTCSSSDEVLFYAACRKNLPPSVFAKLYPQATLHALGCEIGGSADRAVDFAISLSAKNKWVIEIDGCQHEEPLQKRDDDLRTQALERAGWSVFRITAATVRENPDAAVAAWLEKIGNVTANRLLEVGSGAHWAAKAEDFGYQTVYFPCCVQRVLRALIHALRSGALHPSEDWHIQLTGAETEVSFCALAVLRKWWGHLYDLGWSNDKPPSIVTYTEARLNSQWNWLSEFTGLSLPVQHVPASRSGVCSLDFSGALPPGAFVDKPDSNPQIIVRAGYRHQSVRTGLKTVRKFYPSLHELMESRGGASASAHRRAAEQILALVFGHAGFREGQYESLARLISGRDTISLLPTGGGKSIIIHLSGLILPGMSLVVEPLVSLIDDQVENLRHSFCDANGGISSAQTKDHKLTAEQQFECGELQVLFISPERLQMDKIRDSLRRLSLHVPITLAAIDEAHCVSEWGHDFRPAYLHLIHNLRRHAASLGGPPVISTLTGTASYSVLSDIQAELGIQDEQALITPKSFERKEIQYTVLDTNRDWAGELKALKRRLPDQFRCSPEHFKNPQSGYGGLIFCGTVGSPISSGAALVKVAGELGHPHVYCGKWPGEFAGDKADWGNIKRETLINFKKNRIQEVISTKSLGMGFDKPNVRYVIHTSLPESVESFYQESGRAGRDGIAGAQSYILVDKAGLANQRVWVNKSPIDTIAALDRERGDWKSRAFFLKQGFPSAEKETNDLIHFYNKYPIESGRVYIPFGGEGDPVEKVIFRCVVLGLIHDYTKDYKAKSFCLIFNQGITAAGVIRNLQGYLKRCKFDDYVTAKFSSLTPSSLAETFAACARIYVNYVYEEVLLRRLQSLKTMSELCYEFKADFNFRSDMLSYLQDSRFTEVLKVWAGKSIREIGSHTIISTLSDCKTMEEFNLLLGTTRRMLDNDPSNIGFRLIGLFTKLHLNDNRQLEADVKQLLIASNGEVGPQAIPVDLATHLWDSLVVSSEELAAELDASWFSKPNRLQVARSILDQCPDSLLAHGPALDQLMTSAMARTQQILSKF